jgi:hypothetical protein
MKLVYNLGGINHARDALPVDHRSYKQRSFTASEKVQILQAVDRLVEEENLPHVPKIKVPPATKIWLESS